MHPEILLFEEVPAAMDPEMVREVLDVMLDLAKQGKTMLISSHDLDEMASVATSCLFIHDGGLHNKDSMDVIRDEAASLKEYYRRLMKAVSL